LTEADKKINDLRRTLVLLRQQGVITIEEFNSMSASVTEYGDAISEIERKKEKREKTKDRLGVLTDAGLAEKGNHNIAKDKAKREKYFDRVYTFGDELSSKGLSEEAIKSSIGDKNAALAKSGAANAYKEINDALISIKNNIDDIDNKNKEFTKGI